ncbi:MAG: GTPase HflX [Clostridiales bacterium]|nr:GTPase HflX [Clostridiales bacterium]
MAEERTLFDTENNKERRAVLCAVYDSDSEAEASVSLDELERLAETAGAVCSARLTQMRDAPDRRTVIGSGKCAELNELCSTLEADLVVFDTDLTPSQIKSLEDEIDRDVQVIDRSMLILDIFASHARSAEGVLQVELAQLKYTAPRLVGHGREMSRLGGAASGSIGSRGPGETKLELDRRRIRARIASLETELEKVARSRAVIRRSRERSGIKRCAIVGYTNAGKSTLLNRLTDAGILAEDKLFATLDTTTRKYTLPGGADILLTDTVGFIRKLPHHLIKAFRSTLEEAVYSDLLMIIIDASDPAFSDHLSVTENLLEELGAGDKPKLYVLNKCDKADSEALNELKKSDSNVHYAAISALTGEGVEDMISALEAMLMAGKRTVKLSLPQSAGAAVNEIYMSAENVEINYTADSIEIKAVLDERLYGKFGKYVTEE